jgi:anaerobic selenocysteine-containing dehydrogenase
MARVRSGPHVDVITGVCPHDCPDTCSFQVSVDRDSGRALDIWGHPDHPVTRGALCTKVDRYLERTYHEGRLLTPLKRVGNKGEGRFAPVGWDEALRDIGARLRAIVGEHGAEAVLPYSYAGTMGMVQGEGMAARFFHKLGASRLARTICAEAGYQGISYTLGKGVGTDPEAFAHADLIWIWGSNTLTSNLHLWPIVLEARERGARVVVIDPVRTKTARQADAWVGIRPGSDGALALGIMHVLVRDQLVDHAYLERATVGFALLAERVREYPPELVAEHTGLPASVIERLAHEYGRARAPAIRVNYGLQRHAGGGMAVRNIACLPALVGAWQRPGGGVVLSTSGFFPFDYAPLRRPDLLAGREPRTINMNRLGDALSRDVERRARAHHHPRPAEEKTPADRAGPEVKALIVYNSNPAAVAPDQGAVRAGLAREDLFTIVLEHFQTDTADWADYVLPATTQLEHWDLVKPYGHLHLGLNRPAIAPVGESRPNSQIFRDLARALGFDEPCFSDSDEDMLRELLARQHDAAFATTSFDTLLERGYARIDVPALPFADGHFPTPSGKCELYSARMLDDGYDPLPTYTPPHSAAPDARHPLLCISPPAHGFLNSTFVNLERLRRREGEPRVWLHPADAAPRGLGSGDEARVFNALGEVRLKVLVTDDVVQGTVVAPGVWWSKLSPDRRNVNQLVPQDEADMGSGALFYDVRVEVAPWVGG